MALLLLLSKRKRAVERGLKRGLSIAAIANDVGAAVSGAILEARTLSSLKGIKSLVRELETLGIDVSRSRIAASQDATLLEHVRAARKTGSSYGKQWRTKATGKSVSEAARAASTDTNAALHRIGVTESSKGYGTGRKSLAERVATTGPKLYRVYDAVLDKRVCPSCEGSDGDIVGLKERFRYGEPGTIHPNCRCTWSLLTESEIDSGSLIQAA